MNVYQALGKIAEQTGLNVHSLRGAAYDYQWGGTVENEYRVIYALIRELKPARCLELGTARGEGATCIAGALIENTQDGKPGHLTTVDNDPTVGSLIPDILRPYVTIIYADINIWIRDAKGYNFIFEDGAHSIHQVQEVYTHLFQLLSPGGIIVSHDAAMEGVSEYIRQGQLKAGYDLPIYVIDPLPYGITVYRRPVE